MLTINCPLCIPCRSYKPHLDADPKAQTTSGCVHFDYHTDLVAQSTSGCVYFDYNVDLVPQTTSGFVHFWLPRRSCTRNHIWMCPLWLPCRSFMDLSTLITMQILHGFVHFDYNAYLVPQSTSGPFGYQILTDVSLCSTQEKKFKSSVYIWTYWKDDDFEVAWSDFLRGSASLSRVSGMCTLPARWAYDWSRLPTRLETFASTKCAHKAQTQEAAINKKRFKHEERLWSFLPSTTIGIVPAK